LSLEGIPQHAWTKEVADDVLCDEAIIHYVNEETMDKSDQRSFNCWAFSRDPSRIPQEVLLTLTNHEGSLMDRTRVHFSRLREVKQDHVFRVLVHIDTIEDLL
jgi:hypothetical protein